MRSRSDQTTLSIRHQHQISPRMISNSKGDDENYHFTALPFPDCRDGNTLESSGCQGIEKQEDEQEGQRGECEIADENTGYTYQLMANSFLSVNEALPCKRTSWNRGHINAVLWLIEQDSESAVFKRRPADAEPRFT